MGKSQSIKEHITSARSSEVAEICDSFFEKIGLNYFDYLRIYNGNELVALTNDDLWADYFCANKFPIIGTVFQQGVYLWDVVEECNYFARDAKTHFNHTHGITIIKKKDNFCESFSFAAPANNLKIINFYMNNMDILEKFYFYFKDKAHHLIKQANIERFIIPDSMCNKIHNKLNYKDIYNLIKTNKFHLNFNSKEIILSKREYEVILQFAQGKTAKEVGRALDISPKTVDIHLSHAKDKSGCFSRYQLIDIVRKNLIIPNLND